MMKGQKGITLVALIITIIVMLILVGVSITVAMNGGLFDKARDASEKTTKSQVKEAMALTKAELLADFYDGTDTTKPTEANVKGRIETYLDGITVTVTEAEKVYTVAPDGITLDSDENKIDLSSLNFAS